jgi:hypothetical protein
MWSCMHRVAVIRANREALMLAYGEPLVALGRATLHAWSHTARKTAAARKLAAALYKVCY